MNRIMMNSSTSLASTLLLQQQQQQRHREQVQQRKRYVELKQQISFLEFQSMQKIHYHIYK